MKVELVLYASLKNYLPEENGKTVLEVEAGTTVEGLLNKLRIPPGSPKIIFLNGVHAQGNEVLKDGDRVGAFPPVAGG
jgi:molybdopterin synthase sulfur carrier subunit